MRHIKTASGFEADIDEAALDDMELLDDLVALDKGDYTALPRATTRLLGDAKKALYDHVRAENGRVPMKAFANELGEIIKALNQKN